MKKGLRIGFALIMAGLLMAGLGGCLDLPSTGRVSWKAGAESRPEQLAYQKAIEPFVQEASIYQGLANELMYAALPLNPTVRKARARRIAVAKGWDQARTRQAIEDSLSQACECHEIVLSVHIPETSQNNLAAKKPEWQVFLWEPDGNRVRADHRKRISDRDTVNEAIYPFWGLWDRLYFMRFPKNLVSKQGKYRLEIVDAAGRTELEIDL